MSITKSISIKDIQPDGQNETPIDLAESTRESGLTLRALNEDSGFSKTVTCKKGFITIISGEDLAEIKLFMDALSGREAPVLVKLDGGEIYSSEIYSTSDFDRTYLNLNPDQILSKLGLKQVDRVKILSHIGLLEDLETTTHQLDLGKLARLKLLVAIFSKSKIVYFDNPFKDIPGRWIEQIALLLSQGAKIAEGVFVVTNLEELPQSWNNSSNIRIEGFRRGQRRKTSTFLPFKPKDLDPELISVLKSELSNNRSYLVTRPFLLNKNSSNLILLDIYKRRENIENPNIEEIGRSHVDRRASKIFEVSKGILDEGRSVNSKSAISRATKPSNIIQQNYGSVIDLFINYFFKTEENSKFGSNNPKHLRYKILMFQILLTAIIFIMVIILALLFFKVLN